MWTSKWLRSSSDPTTRPCYVYLARTGTLQLYNPISFRVYEGGTGRTDVCVCVYVRALRAVAVHTYVWL